MIDLFDSHAHYDDRRFKEDGHELLKSLPQNGVSHVVNIGCDLPSSRASIELAERYEHVYATVGIHPHSAIDAVPQDLPELEKMISHPKVVALGEIGLDYHYDFSPRDVQRKVFAQQMELAERLSVPIVIHEREAFSDCFDIVSQYNIKRGVFHCYSGSVESAKRLVDMGYYLSFTGVITFANARRAIEVIEWIPQDRLLVETDAPYLTPVPFRGKRNDSLKMKHTVEKMAQIRGISFEQAAKITSDNAKRFYGIE